MIFFDACPAFSTDGKRLALRMNFREKKQEEKDNSYSDYKLIGQFDYPEVRVDYSAQRNRARRRAFPRSGGKDLL